MRERSSRSGPSRSSAPGPNSRRSSGRYPPRRPRRSAPPHRPRAPRPAAPAPAPGPACNFSTHYVNSAGNCVPRPTDAASLPPGATAKCKNGSCRFSQNRSGTCSGNGGVERWL
ncbi:DUF3761 domain-containing protein [Pseudonocardia sp. NPDC046786]|uniref:DUF3761 domain-containing protein n=1 Tax=Pseudonocardia sp. NPDC046786 TaxID=3155471 RepID=UPI0033DFDA14